MKNNKGLETSCLVFAVIQSNINCKFEINPITNQNDTRKEIKLIIGLIECNYKYYIFVNNKQSVVQ